jgi:hypothetical protein
MRSNIANNKPSESYSAGFQARNSNNEFLSKPNNHTNDWYFGWIHSDNQLKETTGE